MHLFLSKKIRLAALALLLASAVSAQQEPQYTQFTFNQLSYNPAYAGSFISPTLTAIYRNQWMGIKGSPKTQILSYSMPMAGENLGLGLNLRRHTAAITRSVTVEIAYCYRIKLQRGHLGIGVMPSVRSFSQNWADPDLYASTPAGTDQGIPTQAATKWLANIGGGVYFSNEKWYAGIGVPRIIQLKTDFSEFGNEDAISREVLHFNAMGGVNFDPNEDLRLSPQLLIKYVPNAPVDVEANFSALLRQRFYGALGYRVGGDVHGLGESIDLLLGMQATEKLFFCLSYDFGLTRLQRYSSGSLEATVRWWFNPPAGGSIQGTDDL